MTEISETTLVRQARILIESLTADVSALRGENMLLKRRIAQYESVPEEMIW